jgi:cytochrome c-type biogenesis protein CcmH/NrfF
MTADGPKKKGLCLPFEAHRRVVLALVAFLALALAVPASAATPQTTLADVEDEVMCPICGTLLELAEAPQAQRQKVFIAGLIAEGRTKAEIKDALVAEYGPAVLAQPEGSGFNLSAYLVPLIAFVIAIVALALGVARWRRESKSTETPPEAEPSDEDAKRLEADLAKYDL